MDTEEFPAAWTPEQCWARLAFLLENAARVEVEKKSGGGYLVTIHFA